MRKSSLLIVLLACAAAEAWAQPFPAKPIRLLSTVSGGIDGLVRVPYQPVKDFTPITQAASAIAMIVVHPAVPVN